ncbi:MAG: rod-binding protein, partial [Pseudomonas sp.]|nr:rod-binding protein [Pseudomonas sp.]
MNSRLSAGVAASHDSGAFTDLNRLSQLKNGKDRDSDGNIHKVAQEFESLFVNEMMKAMRKAGDVLGDDNFMNSHESKTYRDMYDQQLAVTMSKQNGVGLASVLERQLSKSVHPGAARANPFASLASGQPASTVTATAATAATERATERADGRDD